jgi:single-strand DNA-binding protein
MAGSLNRCEFIGNLGADPDVKTVKDKKMANLSIACTESWKDQNGEKKERTEWVRVVIWSEPLAKVAEQYLKKGSKVYISGQMQTRKYEKDGRDVWTTEIVLQGFDSKLLMLDGRRDGEQSAPKQEPSSAQKQNERVGLDPDDSDIPF